MKIYDLVVIGTGLSGALAAVKTAEAGLNVMVIDRGQALKDRRNLVSGWLGKSLYTMSRIDYDRGEDITEALSLCREANGGRLEWCQSYESQFDPLYVKVLSHYQAKAECGRELAQILYNRLKATSADILFGTELRVLEKNENFIFHTTRGKLGAKRCLIATGSHSAERLMNICSNFELHWEKIRTKFGVRVEIPARLLKPLLQVMGDFRLIDETNNILIDDVRQNSMVGEREDDGLLSAFTHVIPGKKSERTNFMISVENDNFVEIIKLVKIINILSNDKIKRERATDFISGNTVLEHFEQFNPIKQTLLNLNKMIPSFLNSALIYVPEIRIGGSLKVDENMRTGFSGLYGAGGCTLKGANSLGAMMSGIIAAKSITEDSNG